MTTYAVRSGQRERRIDPAQRYQAERGAGVERQQQAGEEAQQRMGQADRSRTLRRYFSGARQHPARIRDRRGADPKCSQSRRPVTSRTTLRNECRTDDEFSRDQATSSSTFGIEAGSRL